MSECGDNRVQKARSLLVTLVEENGSGVMRVSPRQNLPSPGLWQRFNAHPLCAIFPHLYLHHTHPIINPTLIDI